MPTHNPDSPSSANPAAPSIVRSPSKSSQHVKADEKSSTANLETLIEKALEKQLEKINGQNEAQGLEIRTMKEVIER
jgi:hypothetical protein